MNFLILSLILFQFIFWNTADRTVPWVSLIPARKVSHTANDEATSQHDDTNKKISALWTFYNLYFRSELGYSDLADRYSTFYANVRRMSKHNEAYHRGDVHYEMGFNDFTDKSNEELGYLSCLKIPDDFVREGSAFLSSVSIGSLPEFVDWRSSGAVTKVKNQGNCGSCWAFSTTGAIEGQYFLKFEVLVNLSEQQLVDCNKKNYGCSGGLMDSAFKYVERAGGIDSETYYPYTSGFSGEAGNCSFRKESVVATVYGLVDIPQGDEEALMKAVALHGPVSVAINAGLPSFMSYSSGVYSDPDCDSQLDHGVLLVGYGEEKGIPYWLIKNSWGGRWGEDGYIKIERNAGNMCGVASMASYPLVQKVTSDIFL